MEAYTDESDVFEEDVESILYQEAQVDRRKGFTDCLLETHLDTTEYPYPAYLAKLSTLFTDESAFGKNPEEFIYCNNLLPIGSSGRTDGRIGKGQVESCAESSGDESEGGQEEKARGETNGSA
ncbi:hypothetical protein BBJ29_009811 [Phytophthora kernoviae]|uniref:Uncharacterized protein n=1 Tax=Phytophthora kernoviae TaxID=325452 RepID=A0A3F2S0N1_9STRA|nr:hypothetical protein BBJ29_009811 [Phytophthora kernoviae]RLN67993.1 hypothetical protein BBP00_00001235 [Phytophthora kernoviae]